jgi:hypothetical protein
MNADYLKIMILTSHSHNKTKKSTSDSRCEFVPQAFLLLLLLFIINLQFGEILYI